MLEPRAVGVLQPEPVVEESLAIALEGRAFAGVARVTFTFQTCSSTSVSSSVRLTSPCLDGRRPSGPGWGT